MKKALLILATVATSVFVSNMSVTQAILAQGLQPPSTTQGKVQASDIKDNPIIRWIEFFINVLSVTILAGGSVMIAWAGIQYMTARDNAQNVQAAKEKIWNVVFGLVAYFFCTPLYSG
ncbi:MAG: hypothetical protein R3B12_00095 [Candidatus Saccharimonadales bacterium]